MAGRVEILRTARILDDFFKVDEAFLRHERFDGSMSEEMRRLKVERGDAAAAVVVERETGDVILVEQFRYPTHERGPGWIIEAVAGMVAPDEDPADAMRREILEEMGYAVDALEPIGTFYLSPGGSSERVFLFLAEVSGADRIGEGGGVDGEMEDIRLVRLPRDEVGDAVSSARYADAKTLVGLMWLLNRRDVHEP